MRFRDAVQCDYVISNMLADCVNRSKIIFAYFVRFRNFILNMYANIYINVAEKRFLGDFLLDKQLLMQANMQWMAKEGRQ